MNEIVIEELSSELNIKINQIKAVLTLLEEGSTIPFIARYRKEATGALDENQIKSINDLYSYYNNLSFVLLTAHLLCMFHLHSFQLYSPDWLPPATIHIPYHNLSAYCSVYSLLLLWKTHFYLSCPYKMYLHLLQQLNQILALPSCYHQ